MDNLVGMKELYDINIRLNQPLQIGSRKYDINETILSFERADIAQINESKHHKTAKGGFNNNLLIDWEIDTQATFAITHGILSPTTWAVLSNSKLNESKKKSVPYKESVDVIEDDNCWYCLLKYIPNHRIIKIKDQTKIAYDISKIEKNQMKLKGIFSNEMLRKMKE